MNYPLSPEVFIAIAVAVILVILAAVTFHTCRWGSRLAKLSVPKPPEVWVSALQVVVAAGAAGLLRAAHAEPAPALAASLGILILSGFPFYKMAFRMGWIAAFRLWGVTAALQIVILPLTLAASFVICFLLLLWIFPPVY
jgi:hypothetical protein